MKLLKLNNLAMCVLFTFSASWAVAYEKPVIYKFDVRYADGWAKEKKYDLHHTAVGLQGLVNRQAPRVFLIFDNYDETWLNRLVEEGGLCEGWSIETINTIEEYINRFSSYAAGVVLYDADPSTGVISTMLAATTAAACEGSIAVRKDTSSDSMYMYLTSDSEGPLLQELIDLTGKFTGTGTIWQTSTSSTGSAKCDAYIWMKEKYIDTGKCDTKQTMFTMDLWGLRPEVPIEKSQLRNLDFAYKKKTVCFELSPWADEVPNDDPSQPLGADTETMKSLLDSCNVINDYNDIITCSGYINWEFKYTDNNGQNPERSSHEVVPTEWELVNILSNYNTLLDADAPGLTWVSNCSFYNGLLPEILKRRYVQNQAPSYQDMVDKGFIDGDDNVVPNNYMMFYAGDYDQTSWLMYWLSCDRYTDRSRGLVYCNWAITGNNMERGGPAIDYMYRNKSNMDYFICGHSGAGYIHPTQLDEPRPNGYPSIIKEWQSHCKKYYRLLDYSITGWILNLGSPEIFDESYSYIYSPFSGDGLGFDDLVGGAEPSLQDDMPMIKRTYPDFLRLGENDSIYLSELEDNLYPGTQTPNFVWWRTILVYPDIFRKLQLEINSSGHTDYKIVDAYTFYYLLRYHLCGENVCHAAWISDDIPTIAQSDSVIDVTVTARNDAWDTWDSNDNYRLVYALVPKDQELDIDNSDFIMDQAVPVSEGNEVLTGETYSFDLQIDIPAQEGEYDLYYDMCRTLTVLDDVLLVTNGSFVKNFADWRHFAVNGGTEQCSISTDSYDNDQHAAWLRITGVTPTSDQGLDRDGPDTPKVEATLGNTYRVTFAAKNLGASDKRVMLSVAEYDFNNTWLMVQDNPIFNAGSSYSVFTYDYQVKDQRTALLNIAFRIVNSGGTKTTGDFLIDAVSVTDVNMPSGSEEVLQFFRDTGTLEWKTTIKVLNDIYSVDTDGDSIPDVVEIENGMLEWNPDDIANCGDLGMLSADTSGTEGTPDCYVNQYDFTSMASKWTKVGEFAVDLDGDGIVGVGDLRILALQWLECIEPNDSNCWNW